MSELAKSFLVTFDAEVDAAYIYLRPIAPGEVARTVSTNAPNGLVNLDFDSEGRLVGIEIVGAAATLPDGVVI